MMTREQFDVKAAEILDMRQRRDLMELLDSEQFLEAKWHVFFEHDQKRIGPCDCDCLLSMIRTMELRAFALTGLLGMGLLGHRRSRTRKRA